MRALLREPLLHFALLGAILFALFATLNQEQSDADPITVTTAQQQQLAAAFQRVWRRPPTAGESKGLIDDWVREELANRQALAMALDRDDLVIRRRLRQKYESLMEQIASAIEPTDAELTQWYNENTDRYLTDSRYSLVQRFFSSDRRDNAAADARVALQALASAGKRADSAAGADSGDPISLPTELADVADTELKNRFGTDFVSALDNLPPGSWAGPVPSAFGQHLVYLRSRQTATVPPLASVIDEVRRDWRSQKRLEAREALYDNLLNRYEVIVEARSDRTNPTGS
jgi:parvulin-like peptidyl-prolyl isomerase